MDKDTEIKSLEKLAAVFGTTAEELYETTNKSEEVPEDLDVMKDIMSVLTQREQDVLRLRYGLDDGRKKTLEEVGTTFGVSASRIRQIEARALSKLKKHAKDNNQYVQI